jgi:hypothetical protein
MNPCMEIPVHVHGGQDHIDKGDITTLTKVTLTTIPIHVSIVIKVSPWIYNEINKLCRAFIWMGKNPTQDGHCKVAWSCVTWSQELGGVGVLDLTMHAQIRASVEVVMVSSY